MRVLKDVSRKNKSAVVIAFLITATDIVISVLYNVKTEPAIYSALISLFILATVIIADFIREKKKSSELDYALLSVLSDRNCLPEPTSSEEEKYQEMIFNLGKRIEELTEDFDREQQDSLDYYTAWVHQIKTPIAVMKLKLSDDTPENHALSAELFRIEQYVDMVLQYLRLGSKVNDLVIREYDLDELVKESIRKFAPQFIEKKLSLDFTETKTAIVTDKKWFACILEQFISNAIKYTPSGTISVDMENGFLVTKDNGIGIAEEDLPRIFEKGYTGNNGRIGQKSSGLGLYLAKKASSLLNIPLSVSSSVGNGSSFSMDLRNLTQESTKSQELPSPN